MSADAVLIAHKRLERAEQAIADATEARDEACERLDEALEARGWRRLRSVIGPGVYAHRSNGHATDLAGAVAAERDAA